jgi:cysteine sulfinate desulfinase/cysteine desulfurase-like protein
MTLNSSFDGSALLSASCLHHTVCQQTERFTTLTVIQIQDNGLEGVGGRALAEALRFNTALRSVDFSFNDMGVLEVITKAWHWQRHCK